MSVFFITFTLTHSSFFFFFNDTATTEIYTLSLHDALPIYDVVEPDGSGKQYTKIYVHHVRSEEHTSELQSPKELVCRLLLEKKKIRNPHKSRRNRKAKLFVDAYHRWKA